MNERKKAMQLMNEFMRMPAIKNLSDDDQKLVWDKLYEVASYAKLEVIEDAENHIAKLRTFSLWQIK